MLYQDQNDETLVMLTLAGEQRAYEVLVVRYQKAVMSAAFSVTRSNFVAEDAAQDAFVTAWMKLNTLQDPQKFAPWTCRIAKNCAANMLARYRSFLPLEAADGADISNITTEDPEYLYTISEEKDELRESLGKLPEKVRQIIHLHYFEDLSVAEIAERLGISAGTVKWQLHNGRKKLRKELCAMNEDWNDTLAQRVMKKVEELKLWQLKNNKKGFEKAYKDVLSEVEDLPESKGKYHALADVLARGWWWLPGEKNDELFAKIKEAAENGKNDEVMEFIVAREDSHMSGTEKIEFMRDVQIPRLEKAGFVRALAREWFWLAYNYYRNGEPAEGEKAYNKAKAVVSPSDSYYALSPMAIDMEKKLANRFKGVSERAYRVFANVDELRVINGELRYWKWHYTGEGYICSVDTETDYIIRMASKCDGVLFKDGLAEGDVFTGSDGSTLTYAGCNETVETPCGVFEGCKLWVTRNYEEYAGNTVNKCYYKEGVGIVKCERLMDGIKDVRLLSSYRVVGGDGLLPLAAGNSWSYSAEYSPETLEVEFDVRVTYADGERVIVASEGLAERKSYNDNSWLEMIQQIRNCYYREEKGKHKIADVYYPIKRAQELARTPMEKAHTKAACSVARRIMETDGEFNPKRTAKGLWNFFSKNFVKKEDGRVRISYNHRWSFEWKNALGTDADRPLLYNNLYDILYTITGQIWSEEWKPGYKETDNYMLYNKYPFKRKLSCEKCDNVITKAGEFENCIRLTIESDGLETVAGHSYMGGKKVYYFAEKVGIVRTENEYCEGLKTAVYELAEFNGYGEGYMPFEGGMLRRYEAVGLTDGFVGAAEYIYETDPNGEVVIFSDRTGIQKLPEDITFYSSIKGEREEAALWLEGKREESRLRHDINNLHLFLHMLNRDGRALGAAGRKVAQCKYTVSMLKVLGGGKVPEAWYGKYCDVLFRAACASFGSKDTEEGYRYLDECLEVYSKWSAIPAGAELEADTVEMFGGVKLIKNKELIRLPNGSLEPIRCKNSLTVNAGNLYARMTARKGWEWFDTVRGQARFEEYKAKIKKLMELEKQ